MHSYRYISSLERSCFSTMARNPNGQVELCKTFVWWFDSIPRLHSKPAFTALPGISC